MKYIVSITVFISILSFTASANSPKGIQIIQNEAQRKIDILYDGKLFTSYIYPSDLEKPVLYPIYTAKGTLVTRGFPLDPRPYERVDHPHQVGLWFNFGDVNGIDFWNNSYAIPAEKKSNYGFIRHRSVSDIFEGLSESSFTAICEWTDYTGKALLREESQFRFSGEGDWRIIERNTKLTALQDKIIFTDNKEGLFAIRMDRAFEEPETKPEALLDCNGKPTDVKSVYNKGVAGVYRNSNGLEKGDVWGKTANWVSLSADKSGEKITVAILDNKQNPGYPAHFHARGYGLFAINNMGSRSFDKEASLFSLTLNPGETVTFKHLIIIKTGGYATNEELNHRFNAFNK